MIVNTSNSHHPIICFVSHKCESPFPGIKCKWKEDVALRDWLKGVFATHNVVLKIDDFPEGADIKTRIETSSFDALLFLFCNESWRSEACQAERDVARKEYAPVFFVRLRDELPPELRNGRIIVDLPLPPTENTTAQLEALAKEIHDRGELRRWILAATDWQATALEQRKAACQLEDAENVTALAEFVDLLDSRYDTRIHPEARACLVRAVAKCRTSETIATLQRWQSLEAHPLFTELFHKIPKYIIVPILVVLITLIGAAAWLHLVEASGQPPSTPTIDVELRILLDLFEGRFDVIVRRVRKEA